MKLVSVCRSREYAGRLVLLWVSTEPGRERHVESDAAYVTHFDPYSLEITDAQYEVMRRLPGAACEEASGDGEDPDYPDDELFTYDWGE